jgi:hypothetical protein
MLAVRLQAPGDEPRLDAVGWEGEKTARSTPPAIKKHLRLGGWGNEQAWKDHSPQSKPFPHNLRPDLRNKLPLHSRRFCCKS